MGKLFGTQFFQQNLEVAKGTGDGLEGLTKKLAAVTAYEKSGANTNEVAALKAALGLPPTSGESEVSRGNRLEDDKIATAKAALSEDQAKAKGASDSVEGYGLALSKAGYLSQDPKTGAWTMSKLPVHRIVEGFELLRT